MQSRSDTDVDVFVLHGITPPPSPVPNVATKSSKKIFSSTSTTAETTTSTRETVTSPNAADILSKLISDMPPPKHPKNFIVFAPVADTENEGDYRKGRRLDTKVVVHEADDLVAEESVISEEASQDLGTEKFPLNRKIRHPAPSVHSLKPGMRPPVRKKGNWKEKINNNSRFHSIEPFSESPPNFIKRPRGEFVTFPSNYKPPVNTISSRNGAVTHPRPTENFQQHRNSFMNQHQINNKGGMQNFEQIKSGPDRQTFRDSKNSENSQSRNSNQGFRPSMFQNTKPQQFHSEDSSPGRKQNFHGTMESSFKNQFMKDNSRDNQPAFQNNQNVGTSINSQTNLQGPSQPNFANLPQNAHSPEVSQLNSGGPQYFAPPPQTFHTKLNYDQTSSKFTPPTTFEKVAQSSVDASPDGTHHHHHHHHHHEPVPSNSDAIGDVNYSDVPRVNDADRLGTIGIGMGPSRGITLQIGGGGGGLGGLGGLLPLGTLGIVKNIASALLPRPQLGLNSKVFLGVEVGRGGGLSVGLG